MNDEQFHTYAEPCRLCGDPTHLRLLEATLAYNSGTPLCEDCQNYEWDVERIHRAELGYLKGN